MTTHQQTAAALAERWKEREAERHHQGDISTSNKRLTEEMSFDLMAGEIAKCRRELCAAFGLDSGSLPLATQPPSEEAPKLRKPSEEPTA